MDIHELRLLEAILWCVLKSQATSEKSWLIIWPYLVFKEGEKKELKLMSLNTWQFRTEKAVVIKPLSQVAGTVG